MLHQKKNKLRSKQVDDQIEALHRDGVKIFMIARAVPIGEKYVRICLKERGILKSREPKDRVEVTVS